MNRRPALTNSAETRPDIQQRGGIAMRSRRYLSASLVRVRKPRRRGEKLRRG